MKVLILVEGYTEEQFIKIVLSPHFEQKGIFLTPTIITTKETVAGKYHKGGVTTYRHFSDHMKKLLEDTNAVAVSMMIDLYRLPQDFPGVGDPYQDKGVDRAKRIENCLKQEFEDDRFIPYLSVYEFEALLFSNPDEYAVKRKEISSILKKFHNNPEMINDNSPPSKHLKHFFSSNVKSYEKIGDGLILAGKIGLESMRDRCPHFNEWIKSLERAKPERLKRMTSQ